MDTSLFLAQLIGLYALILGIAVFLRRKTFARVFRDGLEDHPLSVFLIAFFELIAGLAILLSHPVWEWSYRGVITFIGAWMIIEAVLFMLLPIRFTSRFIAFFNKPIYYLLGGMIFSLLGGYLSLVGFGLI